MFSNKSIFRLFSVLLVAVFLAFGAGLTPAHAQSATTWYVTTTGDNSNSCTSAGAPCLTINAAISKAAAGDTIEVAIGNYTGSGTEVVFIDKAITLSGGWDTSFTAQNGLSTLDGQATRQGIVTWVDSVVVDRFQIQHGYSISSGGGIYAYRGLTLNNSIVSTNVSIDDGGGIFVNQGDIPTTINNSTISGNIGEANPFEGGGGGGGIDIFGGNAVLNNSTVSGNSLGGGFQGGGIYVSPNVLVTLNNSTVSGNGGEGIYSFVGHVILNSSTVSNNIGNGITNDYGQVSMQNSILAGNGGRDCFNGLSSGGPVTSLGYNLIGNSGGCSSFTPAVGDKVGTAANPIDPLLGPIQNTGGVILTQALLPGSPAIDAGNPAIPGSGGAACLATDERGVARPQGGACDIGAYELAQPIVLSITRAGPNPTDAASVDFTVIFSEPVTGVDVGDFSPSGSGISGASVTKVSGSGATYTVSVATGTGDGALRLDVVDDNSIEDLASSPLGGAGSGNGDFNSGESYTVDTPTPMVASIRRASPDPTRAASVDFTVTFYEPVTGVDASDFSLSGSGVSGASVTKVSGSGAIYTVSVNIGSGEGLLRLDVVDDDSIVDSAAHPLGGTGSGNGNFSAGESYTVDKTSPVVLSIARANPNPTRVASVDFTVTFSEPVTGVDALDFSLSGSSVSGPSVADVSGSGAVYTVSVNTGTHDGTLRLDVIDDDSIVDVSSRPLGGVGRGNGNFTTGETYTVYKPQWYVATTGNDSNPCTTIGAPCQTISVAINKAAAGDTIAVAAGTYIGTGSDAYVAYIWRNVTLLGGWNADFSLQNGLSVLDGQYKRTSVFSSGGGSTIDHFRIIHGGGPGVNDFNGLTINNSIISDNYGAGIFAAGGLTLNNSTVENNFGEGRGRGIEVYLSNSLTINNSTITGNQGAGIVLDYVNGGGPGQVTTILNSTITNNAGEAAGGGIAISSSNPSRTVTIRNSILADNAAVGGPDCSGTITTSDHNIIGSTSGCTVTAGPGDEFNVEPLVATLPTGLLDYRVLLSGSPAIDAGNPSTCSSADQRGLARQDGDGNGSVICDIGAYEYVAAPGPAVALDISSGSGQSTAPNLDLLDPLVVSAVDSQGSPVSGLPVSFSAPASGPSGTFTNGTNILSVNTDNSGHAAVTTFHANAQSGSYSVGAVVTGLPAVSFDLTNMIWYVAPGGLDSNACNAPDVPCLTINAAIDKAIYGGYVYVASGTYTGTGSAVVTISKSIHILGGWDASFTNENGQSIIDGQYSYSTDGIDITLGSVELSQIMVEHTYSAITNQDSLKLKRVALVQNNEGVRNYGTVAILNSTFSKNTGSAISNIRGTVDIQYSTIVKNTVYADSIYSANGSTTIEIGNSILAGDSSGNCFITNLISDGHNIFSSSPPCYNSVSFPLDSTDQVGVDPQLGPLLAAGYHVPLSSSPAVDAGNPATCPTTDQRGIVRPQGSGCDIGAYEYVVSPGPAAALSIFSGSGQMAVPDYDFPHSMVVYVIDSQGSPVEGAHVSFSAPDSGPSGTFVNGTTTMSVDTDSNGLASSTTFHANAQFGSYQVSAAVTGLPAVSFSLTNTAWLVAPTGLDSNACNTPAAPCLTINGAIAKAADGDVIEVASGTYTHSGSAVVYISKSLHILGGWNASFTSENGQSIIDGQDYTNYAIDIPWGAGSVELSQIMVERSYIAIDNEYSSLNLKRVAVVNNTYGLQTYGNATILNSTFSGNDIAITSDNSLVILQYSTLANNAQKPGYYAIDTYGDATIEIGNSILADRSNAECYASKITSDGHNIIGSSHPCYSMSSVSLDPTDRVGVNPQLGLLDIAGYHPLVGGGPAIDAGNLSTCPATDQRGVARPQGSNCDIGAYELVLPSVFFITRANPNPTTAASVDFAVTFSDPVTGVDASDFSLTSSGVSGASITTVSGSGATYTVGVNTGSGSGTLRLDVIDNDSIVDLASRALGGVGQGNGNFSAGESYTVDRTAPTVLSIIRLNSGSTHAASVGFTVTFSESVTGVDASDFSLATTGVTGASVTGVSGSGTTRTVTVNTGTGDGTLRLDVVDDDSILDQVSNPLGGAGSGNGNFSSGPAYTVDKTPPTVLSITRVNPDPTNAVSVGFTVTFSEPVYGVVAGGFSLSNSSVNGASIKSISGSGATRTVTVNTGSGDGMLQLDVVDNDSIYDVAFNWLGGTGIGNGNFSSGQTYTVDKTAPTVSMSSTTTDPTNAAFIPVTVTFSESVTGFTSSDIVATNATLSNFVGSGASYSFDLTASTSGPVTANIAAGMAQDAAGNGNTVAPQFSRIYQGPPAVLSIARANPNPTNAASVDFAVTFSEPVTGVDAGDFSLTPSGVSGASVTNVSGSGATYTVSVNTGSGDGTLRLDVVDDDSIVDAASQPLGGVGRGNGNFSAGESYTLDKTAPTVAMSSTATDPTSTALIPVTVTFSESVTGFTASDIAVSNATLSNFAGSGASYNFDLTASGDGAVTADIAAGLAQDAASNNNTAATRFSRTYDSAPTVLSITCASANPTNVASVDFTVIFSKAVSGVDASDFSLVTSGVTGVSITGVSGGPTAYTVSVNTGSGNGSIQLNVLDDNSIKDLIGNPLAAAFSAGEAYTINKPVTLTLNSVGAQDGWIIETSENSNIGGTLNARALTFNLGDNAVKKQYRGILSFRTGTSLPANAVITSVMLKIKKSGVVGGGNPVSMFQGFMVDIKNGFFGATAGLQAGDFQAKASKTYGPFKPVPIDNWYTIDLTNAKGYVNQLATASGLTQVRLRFKLDDNNNAVANTLSLYSGNASVSNCPELIITYTLP